MRKDCLLTLAIAAFALQTPVFGEAIVEIRAVAINDVALGADATTTPSVAPGDKIEAELILLPGWGADFPDGIRGYQMVVGGRVGATSGGNDRVLPVGWDAPLDLIPCLVTPDCPNNFQCTGGQCKGPAHFPSLGVDIDESRPDFLLFGEDALSFKGTTTLNYSIGTTDQTQQGQPDTGSEIYLGTYIVTVGDFACGTFSFTGITTGLTNLSELSGPDQVTVLTPIFVPLELDTGACGPLPSETPDSLNCSLDARYPHSPSSTSPLFAENTFVLSFDVSPSGLSAADFSVSTSPPTFPPPTIGSIQVRGTTATVAMSAAFVDDKWTCIRHSDTNRGFCRGNLPGDSDQNAIVEFDDVDRLLLDLDSPVLVDGQPYIPLPMVACDIDRSGKCTPLDLLASMNLLGGTGTFSPGFLGASIGQDCPSAPAP